MEKTLKIRYSSLQKFKSQTLLFSIKNNTNLSSEIRKILMGKTSSLLLLRRSPLFLLVKITLLLLIKVTNRTRLECSLKFIRWSIHKICQTFIKETTYFHLIAIRKFRSRITTSFLPQRKMGLVSKSKKSMI